MNTCKWCDASGWFNELTENGLCKDCNLRIVNRVQIHARIIRRSLNDLQTARSVDARLRLARRIEEEARALEPFEESDIRTITPAPKDLADQYSAYYHSLRSLQKVERDLKDGVPQVDDPEYTSVRIVDSMDPLGVWKENVVA